MSETKTGGKPQTEEEFQAALPISGTVKTFSGKFELDHGFPPTETAERLYDLMDHQRAAQLYLWGLPLVGMTRWRVGYEQTYADFDDDVFVSVKTFNERRGILTANETTDYLFGFSNTRESAVILEVPEGLTVGMIVDTWQQSPSDIGIFGPNAGKGGRHIIVGPNTPAETLPEPRDRDLVHHLGTDRVFVITRVIGEPEEVDALSSQIRF